jgi:hypothetical protein
MKIRLMQISPTSDLSTLVMRLNQMITEMNGIFETIEQKLSSDKSEVSSSKISNSLLRVVLDKTTNTYNVEVDTEAGVQIFNITLRPK